MSRTPAIPSSSTRHASTNAFSSVSPSPAAKRSPYASTRSCASETRSTTKPGHSAARIGVLRIAIAKFAAAWTVSGDVSSPSITSIRRDPGLKWKPTTWSGRIVISPISVIESRDVVEARIAWPGVHASSSAKTSCLSSISSGTASITKSTSPKPS